MKVRVQMCYQGDGTRGRYVARALMCGGLLVEAPGARWTRAVAAEMRSKVCQCAPVRRRNIRFVHV